MAVGAADLHKSIATLWASSGLNAKFKSYWPDGVSEFTTLNEVEACGEQQWPYCVYTCEASLTNIRMSGDSSTARYENRTIPVEFEVYSKANNDGSQSSKELAAHLVEEIIKVFGGHPTVLPQDLTLDNGAVVQTQYDTEYTLTDNYGRPRNTADEYCWTIRYLMMLDVPVAA